MAGGGAAESEGLNEGAPHKKRRLAKQHVGRRKIVPVARHLPRRRCRYGELSDETELPEPSALPSTPLPAAAAAAEPRRCGACARCATVASFFLGCALLGAGATAALTRAPLLSSPLLSSPLLSSPLPSSPLPSPPLPSSPLLSSPLPSSPLASPPLPASALRSSPSPLPSAPPPAPRLPSPPPPLLRSPSPPLLSPLPSPPLPLSPPPPFPAILWLPSHSSSAIGASLASSSCALVGGGHGLMDSLLGAQIDRHDYVIRVNRGLDASLPLHQTLAPHLGLRQDVLFIDQCEHNSPLYTYRLVGTDNFVTCAASPPHAEDCHFGAIVYRGNSERWEPACSGESQHEPPLHRKARHGYVAVGIETHLVTNAVLSIRGFERHGSSVERKPTTGFHAVLVFGLLCRSLHLYGFEGEATVDGHEITVDHEIKEEHRLLRKLSRHEEIPEMPPAIRQAWAQANLTIWC